MRTRFMLVLSVSILALGGLAFGACSDDSDIVEHPKGHVPATNGAGGVSSSSVAPNTFLMYEGRRYRLANLEQANLASAKADYASAGTASAADIDQTDLTVYRRDGEPEAVYTYADARGDGEEGTPALWYRWIPEP